MFSSFIVIVIGLCVIPVHGLNRLKSYELSLEKQILAEIGIRSAPPPVAKVSSAHVSTLKKVRSMLQLVSKNHSVRNEGPDQGHQKLKSL